MKDITEAKSSLTFTALGDQAVLVYAPDEAAALAFAGAAGRLAWAIDVVAAYKSVAVFYDLAAMDFDEAVAGLRELQWDHLETAIPSRLHVIPCCYELGLDLERIGRHTGLDRERIVALHCGTVYTVYAIGFCPGFPYLGYLPDELADAPRQESPRLKVEAGSVGLTGRQTGIYTEARPGGWNIVGQTPLELVNVRDGYFPLQSGDRIRFEPIGKAEFEARKGERLHVKPE